jgi:hypothetical protein
MHGMWCQMMSTYNLVGAAELLAWQPFNCSFIQGGICINNELKNSSSYTSLSCGWISSKNGISLQVYSIQHQVITIFSDLRQVLWFSVGNPASYTNKTDHHDIPEILLKVALQTINTTHTQM